MSIKDKLQKLLEQSETIKASVLFEVKSNQVSYPGHISDIHSLAKEHGVEVIDIGKSEGGENTFRLKGTRKNLSNAVDNLHGGLSDAKKFHPHLFESETLGELNEGGGYHVHDTKTGKIHKWDVKHDTAKKHADKLGGNVIVSSASYWHDNYNPANDKAEKRFNKPVSEELTLEDYVEFMASPDFSSLTEEEKQDFISKLEEAKKLSTDKEDESEDKEELDDSEEDESEDKDDSEEMNDKETDSSEDNKSPIEFASGLKTKGKELKGKDMAEEIKVDMSEDIDALFNGETLDEEFKEKATTIFEAAVITRVKAEVAELDEIYATQVEQIKEEAQLKIASLEEEFAQKLEEQVEEVKDGLVEHVDGFLNFMVEQWMNDNDVALESGIKAEIAENVITGLHKLFSENFVEVPAEKQDLVSEMEQNLETTLAKLDEQVKVNIALTKTINESKRESLIEKTSQGLTDIDAEKFRDLVEELSFDNAEVFESKLTTIKENYFTKKQVSKVKSESVVITDEPVQELKEEVNTPKTSPVMAAYLKQLGK